MTKYKIEVSAELCTGCLRCELACSFLHEGVFQPSEARIKVRVGIRDCEILFTDQCTRCGICSDNCLYGALTKSEESRK